MSAMLSTFSGVLMRMQFPKIGGSGTSRPDAIYVPERRPEDRGAGALDIAKRVLQTCGQILRYAVGRCTAWRSSSLHAVVERHVDMLSAEVTVHTIGFREFGDVRSESILKR
jgi:hypothetical protein